MPKSTRPHYYTVHAFFLEIMKSREVSREQSICQTRLNWWLHILDDVTHKRKTREPVGVALANTFEHSAVNFNLLSRIVDY